MDVNLSFNTNGFTRKVEYLLILLLRKLLRLLNKHKTFFYEYDNEALKSPN